MAIAWANPSFTKRRIITCDAPSGNLTDFAMGLVLPAAVQIPIADIASKRYLVTDHNGNTLSYEQDHYSEGGTYLDSLWAWCKNSFYASPSGDQNKVAFYYGYDPGSDQDDAANAWDAYYRGRWGLGEGYGNGDTVTDSTGCDNHGLFADADSSSDGAATGVIGQGIQFTGGGVDNVTGGEPADTEENTAWTIEFLAKGLANFEWAEYDRNPSPYLEIYPSGGYLKVYVDGGYRFSETISLASWRSIAVTFDGGGASGTHTFIVDGVALDTYIGGNTHHNASNIWRLGSSYFSEGGYYDEFRCSQGIARSTDWLNLQHCNTFEADNAQTWGAEEVLATARRRVLIGGGIL